jgi:hypothetical protein
VLNISEDGVYRKGCSRKNLAVIEVGGANLLRGKTRQRVPDVAARNLGEDEAYLTPYVISSSEHGRRWRAIKRAQRFLPVWVCTIGVYISHHDVHSAPLFYWHRVCIGETAN